MGAAKSNIRSFRYLVIETQQRLDRLNEQITAAQSKLVDIHEMEQRCAQLHRATDSIRSAYKLYAERYVTQTERQLTSGSQDVLQDNADVDDEADGRGIFV